MNNTNSIGMIHSKLTRFRSTLRTALRDRRALERDLDAAWAEIDELRSLLTQRTNELNHLRDAQIELVTRIRRDASSLAAVKHDLETLRQARGGQISTELKRCS